MVQFFSDWSRWWATLSVVRRFGPLLAAVGYWASISAYGVLKLEHVMPLVGLLILYYGGPRTQSTYDFFLPLILMMVIYDSQRYYADYIRGPIHVKEPYEFDKFFFGIRVGDQILTPSAWFQLHTHWILDLITGFFYIAFIPLFLAIAAWFRFVLARTGTKKRSASYVAEQSPQIMWAFFWLNMFGYSTYYWYAASPPWYADIYGFGPARTDIPGNAAGCVRFDAIFGTHIFEAWYSRAADVHGAIPSLHIAYPLLATYYAFKFGALRATSVQFYLWLCFSAVYLNQHYVLDVLVGSVYALAVGWFIDFVWNARLRAPKAAVEILGLNHPNS